MQMKQLSKVGKEVIFVHRKCIVSYMLELKRWKSFTYLQFVARRYEFLGHEKPFGQSAMASF